VATGVRPPRRLVRVDIPPWVGRLDAWGQGAGGWWALLSWTEQVTAFGESHRPLLCAGWVHASHIRPTEYVRPADYADVPRRRLPDDRKLWPPPPARPEVGWPDRWYVGVLDGGELPLPAGLRRFGQPWP
jgi:hypothetical protein